MFWRRTDQEVIDRPIDFRTYLDSTDLLRERDESRVRTLVIEWHGPFTPSELAAKRDNLPTRGVFAITGVPTVWYGPIKARDTLHTVNYSSNDLSGAATKKARGISDLNGLRIWLGSVESGTASFDDVDSFFPSSESEDRAPGEHDPVLKAARRALHYASQAHRRFIRLGTTGDQLPIAVENRWPSSSGDGALGHLPDVVKYSNDEVHLGWKTRSRFLDGHRVVQILPPPAPQPLKPPPCPKPTLWWVVLLSGAGIAIVGLLIGFFLGVFFGPGSSPTTNFGDVLIKLGEAQKKISALTEALASATTKLVETAEKLEAAEKRITTLTASPQLPPVVSKGGRGIELASCWEDGGKIVSVYRVEIRDGSFAVSPTWRNPIARSWPSGREMDELEPITTPTTLDSEAFRKTMHPYYVHGVQGRNCRFFVDVVDRTTSKESWKGGLALVERYFYKRQL